MKDSGWMEEAFIASTLSDDMKTQVGCVIVCNVVSTILAAGCNNFIKDGVDSFSKEKHKYVIHAEMEALAEFLTSYGISASNNTMYVTHEPCIDCCKHIVASGAITRLVYCRSKPRNSGVELLRELGITVDQFQEEFLHV